MFCPNCGNQLADNADFCSACATQLGTGANAPTQPQQQVFPGQQAFPQQVKPKKIINIFGIYSSVVYILGAVLPLATTSAYRKPMSLSLIDGGSDWFFVMFFALAGVAASIAFMNGALMFFGGVSLLMAFIVHRGLNNDLAYASKGEGYYLLFIGAIGMIISAVIGLIMKHKKKAASASPYPQG